MNLFPITGLLTIWPSTFTATLMSRSVLKKLVEYILEAELSTNLSFRVLNACLWWRREVFVFVLVESLAVNHHFSFETGDVAVYSHCVG
jgi:hypothetical protein